MPVLNPGMVHEEEMLVEEQHTAAHLGSSGLKVLSTPVMVAFMEGAARNMVDPKLEPGHMTVGTALNIKHMAATPVGMRVRARAELLRVEGRWLHFKVEVFDAREKVGEGTHTRAIINMRRFWDKLQTKVDIGLA
jgi:fluoroacetyl-CoA thioesterase